MRDERLVLDLCGNGHCDPDGVVRAGPFANPIGQMTEVGRRRPTLVLRNYVQWKMKLKHHEKVSRSGLCVNLIACDAELRIRDLQELSGLQRGLSCLCESSAEYCETTV